MRALFDRFIAALRATSPAVRIGVGVVAGLLLSAHMAVRASALRSSVPAEQRRLDEMRRNVQEILQLRASGVTARAVDPTSLGQLESSAEASGLRSQITSMNQSGADGITVSFENASFNRILGWLDDLRLNRGIHVKSASIEDAGNNGAVSARLVLQ